jgi:hypothetical protein
LHIAVITWFVRPDGRLLPSAEIIDQIDPSLIRLRLEQYFKRLVKDAPLPSHGDASMRHVQEKMRHL